VLSPIAWSSQDDDLGVVDEPVGNRYGSGVRVEHLAPLSEGQVGRHNSGPLLVPGADDLEEEVRSLLTERKITQFVTNKEIWGLIGLELLEQR